MDLLAMYAATQPDKVAVIDDRPGRPVVTWSFAELNRRANQLAHHLVGLGVDRATKVVWCGQNSAEPAARIHAIRKVGAVGVPLNYRLAAREAAYVIDNSDAEVVYVDAEYAGLISADPRPDPEGHATCWCSTATASWSGWCEQLPDDRRRTSPTAHRRLAATMIYTSGTTGKPKGAVRAACVGPVGWSPA